MSGWRELLRGSEANEGPIHLRSDNKRTSFVQLEVRIDKLFFCLFSIKIVLYKLEKYVKNMLTRFSKRISNPMFYTGWAYSTQLMDIHSRDKLFEIFHDVGIKLINLITL